MSDTGSSGGGATFVLVHGAWHGGWCWRRVEDLLRARSHRVFVPTLTGVADRSHLGASGVDLMTHVQDVVNLIRWEGLSNVVLCGHSYGGMVVSGVAEMAPADAISSIVFLDAFLPGEGKSLLDYTSGEGGAGGPMIVEGEATGLVSPIPAAVFAVNAADAAMVDSLCTNQPYHTFTQGLRLTGARERIAKKAYVLAKGWEHSPFPLFAEMVKDDPAWRYYEVACGHDVMLDEPQRLADILEEVI